MEPLASDDGVFGRAAASGCQRQRAAMDSGSVWTSLVDAIEEALPAEHFISWSWPPVGGY
jgi:hypothetical protein